MRTITTTCCLAITLVFSTAQAQQSGKLYRWVDEDGQVHFGDSIPAEYSEIEKHVVNEHGVAVETLRGKKTAEEIAEEERLAALARDEEIRKRQDAALLATYMTIEEITMHRDRRVELFQAQTRVTELYLRNLNRRLQSLMEEASRFQPYSEDPEAPMIEPDLSADIATTKETIARHESNLERFEIDEAEIKRRFEDDIKRFRRLKGIEQKTAANNHSTSGGDN